MKTYLGTYLADLSGYSCYVALYCKAYGPRDPPKQTVFRTAEKVGRLAGTASEVLLEERHRRVLGTSSTPLRLHGDFMNVC
jgi:hypothetical protein